jgi:hypothetical protein
LYGSEKLKLLTRQESAESESSFEGLGEGTDGGKKEEGEQEEEGGGGGKKAFSIKSIHV